MQLMYICIVVVVSGMQLTIA